MANIIKVWDFEHKALIVDCECKDNNDLNYAISTLKTRMYGLMVSLRDEEMIFQRESVMARYRNGIRYYSDVIESLERTRK